MIMVRAARGNKMLRLRAGKPPRLCVCVCVDSLLVLRHRAAAHSLIGHRRRMRNQWLTVHHKIDNQWPVIKCHYAMNNVLNETTTFALLLAYSFRFVSATWIIICWNSFNAPLGFTLPKRLRVVEPFSTHNNNNNNKKKTFPCAVAV